MAKEKTAKQSAKGPMPLHKTLAMGLSYKGIGKAANSK